MSSGTNATEQMPPRVLGLPPHAWDTVGRVLGLVAVAVVTFALSMTLATLSGTALRLPPPWGVSVQVVMVTLGVGVFAYFRNRNALQRHVQVSEAHKKIERKRRKPENMEEEKKKAEADIDVMFRVRSRRWAVATVLLVLVLVFFYQYLHRQCAWKFTVPIREDGVNWYWAEWGEGTSDDWLNAESLEREAMLASINLPTFLVRESSKMYLPLRVPSDVRQRIIARGRGVSTTADVDSEAAQFARGKANLLNSDPLALISYLDASVDYSSLMERTQLYFYVLHAIVILLVGMAAGLTFAPEHAIRRIIEQMSAEDIFS